MKEDIPKSAKENKNTWALWKFCETITPDEITILIGKRKQDIKYEKNMSKIRELRTDISILTDAYEIMKKRGK
ncbi:MAG: hypothetical protein IMZ52_02760 [Actinobacteria bacterium]|nr:hypothetical protein [Actinomycetota bacterium]MBE3114838.1 hypothetical protein [Actinomycetota bacterium]